MVDKEEPTLGINYEVEYFRLKKLEAENEELKETLLNMCKLVFNSQYNLETVIKDIYKELKTLSRRK